MYSFYNLNNDKIEFKPKGLFSILQKYHTILRNGSDGRALAKYTLAKQVVTGSIPGVPHVNHALSKTSQ